MLTVRTFLSSKKGEESDDCQDSIHPFQAAADDTENCIFAVSDGTTTSFFSRVWARTLTRHFAENPDQPFSNWETWLRDAQEKWQAGVKERAEASDASFFTRNGFHAHKPAAATLAALALGEASENGRSWRALVLGDSCIFFLRENGQPRVLNLETSAEFSSVVKTVESWWKDDSHRPILIESLPTGVESPIAEHDTVLIASDALSKWMLLRHERDLPVWGSVLALNDDSEFVDLVAKARVEAEDPLENDDVALAVLRFGDPHPVYRGQRFEPMPAPQPILAVAIAPLANSQSVQSAHEAPQSTTFRHSTAFSSPELRCSPPKSRWRFAVLFALSALSLAGVLWLGFSRNRALAQAQLSENERERLSVALRNVADEKGKLSGLADRLQAELQAARREIAATERQSQEDAKLRRESQDQGKIFEIGQKADRRKISELQEQIAVLKEQLAKLGQPPALGDAASPPPK